VTPHHESDDGGPVTVDVTCTSVSLLQRMLRQALQESEQTKKQLQAAEARAVELQQTVALKEVEVRKLNKERVAAERTAAAAVERLRKDLQGQLSVAEEALRQREASVKQLTEQLTAHATELEEARVVQRTQPFLHAASRSFSSGGGSPRASASVTAASPSQRIAHRRESLTAAAALSSAAPGPTSPAVDTASRGLTVDPSASPSASNISRAKSVSALPARSPSTAAALLFATQDDGAENEENVKPFEDSDLVGDQLSHEEGQQSPLRRPKARSVAERSQSLSQLDSSQLELQARLKAEMERKTPKQRLRHMDGSEVSLTEATPRDTSARQEHPSVGLQEEASEAHEGPVPMQALDGVPPPRKTHKEHHRERESAVEMSQAAGQAAAASMAEERRQRLVSATARRSDSPAEASAQLDSLLMPITRSLSGTAAQGPSRAERPPSANSTTSSKSPLPGRRMMGSMFRCETDHRLRNC
jgi:hypothetical protein